VFARDVMALDDLPVAPGKAQQARALALVADGYEDVGGQRKAELGRIHNRRVAADGALFLEPPAPLSGPRRREPQPLAQVGGGDPAVEHKGKQRFGVHVVHASSYAGLDSVFSFLNNIT